MIAILCVCVCNGGGGGLWVSVPAHTMHYLPITGETFSHTECDLHGSRRKYVNCLEFIHEYSYVPFIIEYSSIWQEVGNIWSALHHPSPTESNQCCGTEGRSGLRD